MSLPHIIRRGDYGNSVKWVQRRLLHHGYTWLLVDGSFGDKTADAVRRFQRDKKIEVDGIVGPKTQAHLIRKNGTAPSRLISPSALLPRPRPSAGMSIGHRAVTTMEGWAGLYEYPAGSNEVQHLVRLAKRVGWTRGISSMGFSWCDFGVHLALALNGSKHLKASGSWGGYTGMYVPATQNKLEELVQSGRANRIARDRIDRGDILIMFGEGHIGFARGTVKGHHTVPTMECNTSSGDAGSQDNGDGCYKRDRDISDDIDCAYRLES